MDIKKLVEKIVDSLNSEEDWKGYNGDLFNFTFIILNSEEDWKTFSSSAFKIAFFLLKLRRGLKGSTIMNTAMTTHNP